MKISIDATLIYVTTDIIAEQGQHLVVVGNVCVGVHTGVGLNGRIARPLIEGRAERTADSEPAESVRRVGRPPGKASQPVKGSWPGQRRPRLAPDVVGPSGLSMNDITFDSLTKVIAEADGPMAYGDVAKKMRVKSDDLPILRRITRTLEAMTKNRVLRIEKQKSLRGFRNAYVLRGKSAKPVGNPAVNPAAVTTDAAPAGKPVKAAAPKNPAKKPTFDIRRLTAEFVFQAFESLGGDKVSSLALSEHLGIPFGARGARDRLGKVMAELAKKGRIVSNGEARNFRTYSLAARSNGATAPVPETAEQPHQDAAD